jgi:DNA polymerase-3 subunit delta
MEGGRSVDAALREQRVWGARQGSVQGALRRYARTQIENALATAAQVDRAIKGVALGEPWDQLARLGLELVHGTSRPA